jgi:hypothetical protein
MGNQNNRSNFNICYKSTKHKFCLSFHSTETYIFFSQENTLKSTRACDNNGLRKAMASMFTLHLYPSIFGLCVLPDTRCGLDLYNLLRSFFLFDAAVPFYQGAVDCKYTIRKTPELVFSSTLFSWGEEVTIRICQPSNL